MKKWIGYGICLLGAPIWANCAVLVYPFPLVEEIEGEELFAPEVVAKGVNEAIVLRSKTLEQKLRHKIFGQNEAVKETANAIVRYAAGVCDPSQPIASLLYCGPSGVGKTELAKQLALELFGDPRHFIRVNMSEFSEPHSISRLIGAPPGYVGYGEGGSLINRLLDTPCAVVLLDEVEKAHPKVLKLFMHVFDAGYITSSTGQDVDCRNVIFIMTSNLAASEIVDLFRAGKNHKQVLNAIQPLLTEALSPELYNRVDCMVFAPLGDAIFEKLIRKVLGELKERVWSAKGIDVCFDQSLVDYLKTYTLDPKLGARPLKRIVEKELTTVIARAILESGCGPGDGVICSYRDGYILLEVVLSPAEE